MPRKLTAQLVLRMDEDLADRLELLALANDRTVAQEARRAIRTHIEHMEALDKEARNA